MDNLFFLYKLTLLNYITEDIYEDNPLYETCFIHFINCNKNILDSKNKDWVFKIISYLTFELDILFDQSPKKDILKFINKKNYNKDRLRSEIKNLAKHIRKL